MSEHRVAVFEVHVPIPEGVTLEQVRDRVRKSVRSMYDDLPSNDPFYGVDQNKVRVKDGQIRIIVIKPPSDDIHIAKHAIDRFRERTDCAKSDDYIVEKLREFYKKSVEVEVIKKYAAITIIKHNFRPARYFLYDSWVMVIEVMDGRDVLRTIHTGQAKRWQIKKD